MNNFKAGSLLAVYGSLRRGESNDLEQLGGTYLGSGMIDGSLYAVAWYPGIKLSGDTKVHCDLFSIPDDNLCDYLDGYEGYPSLFDREQAVFYPEKGSTAPYGEVWVYTYQGDVDEALRVVSGDWKEYQEEWEREHANA